MISQEALFQLNGKCGYILKPDFLRTSLLPNLPLEDVEDPKPSDESTSTLDLQIPRPSSVAETPLEAEDSGEQIGEAGTPTATAIPGTPPGEPAARNSGELTPTSASVMKLRQIGSAKSLASFHSSNVSKSSTSFTLPKPPAPPLGELKKAKGKSKKDADLVHLEPLNDESLYDPNSPTQLLLKSRHEKAVTLTVKLHSGMFLPKFQKEQASASSLLFLSFFFLHTPLTLRHPTTEKWLFQVKGEDQGVRDHLHTGHQRGHEILPDLDDRRRNLRAGLQ